MGSWGEPPPLVQHEADSLQSPSTRVSIIIQTSGGNCNALAPRAGIWPASASSRMGDRASLGPRKSGERPKASARRPFAARQVCAYDWMTLAKPGRCAGHAWMSPSRTPRPLTERGLRRAARGLAARPCAEPSPRRPWATASLGAGGGVCHSAAHHPRTAGLVGLGSGSVPAAAHCGLTSYAAAVPRPG